MEKKILILGSAIILLMFGAIGFYELNESRIAVEPVLYPDTKQEETELKGYEEAEELIEYMIYQIREQNLDLAMRGCAFQNISEYFMLEYYIRFLERFEHLDLIPPSDTDSEAYRAITNARLAAVYASTLEQLMEKLTFDNQFELLGIVEDVPENPDGKYYTDRESICEILGARTLKEYIIYLKVDNQTMELRCTLARFKKYWKMLSFHSLEDISIEYVDLRRSKEEFQEMISLEAYKEDILPCNYFIINHCSEDNIEVLLKRFFLYLQREDALSAMAYMDIYEDETELNNLSQFLTKQAEAAKKIQNFYYQTFLYDENYYAWVFRDLDDRGGDLAITLSTTNMLFSNLYHIQEVQNDGTQAIYYLEFGFGNQWFRKEVHLVNKNGWKVVDIY